MLDWTFRKEGFGERHYALSNRRVFLVRHVDTGFKTKWCGFWGPPIKHIEYYAYKIKSESEKWLSWDSCTDFSLNPWGAVHRFKADGFDVYETVFIPDGKKVLVSVLKIKNVGPKKTVSLTLEAAVNTRRKHEDWHAREYDSEFSEVRNWVVVRTDTRPWFTCFGAGKTGKPLAVSFLPKNEYKEHNPGSPQRCFLPGDYEVSFEMEAGEEMEIPFIFSCSARSLDEAAHGFDSVASGWQDMLKEKIRDSGPGRQLIRTPDKGLNKAFVWNVMALKSLVHECKEGVGIFAGFPWFLEFWARDSFICIPALNHIGEFKVSKGILEMFMSKKIPSKIDTEGNLERGFADTYPLFILALRHYANSSGDLGFLRISNREPVLVSKEVKMESGLVVHDPEKTWMDSYQRGKSAIEVQSLWAKALVPYNHNVSRRLEGKIGIEYWNPKTGYFLDSRNPEMEDMTANALGPLCLDHVDGQKVSDSLNKLQTEFTTKWGLRTRSYKDKDCKPDAYHKGSVWGLTTGAAACAFLKHGRIEQGLGYLRSLASEMGENLVGGSAEALDADTGKLIGCGMQAWSSGMFITAVDEFLFGIKPELENNLLVLRPRIPDSWDYMERLGKSIGSRSMNLMVRKDRSRISLDINFDSAPAFDAKLVLPSNIRKMIVNGKVFSGHSVEFELKRRNNIVALI